MSVSLDISDLCAQWEQDMQILIPSFRYLRTDRMNQAIDAVRKNLGREDMSDLAVCAFVIRSGSESRVVGIPPSWWWITASLHILPDVMTNPWYEVCWWLYEQSRGKRELNTIWGAANCGKTEFFASVALTNMVVWVGECHVYVTSPWKTHGSDKIWSALRKRARLWEKRPPPWTADLSVNVRVRDDDIVIEDADLNTSTASFVSLDSAASIQGKKRNKPEEGLTDDDRRGLMLLLSDEVTENPAVCAQLAEAEANYVSNPNYMGFVAFNPKPHKTQHPNAISFSSPIDRSVESLNKEVDFTWKTCRGTLIRLCDANSPNRHYARPLFPFLINQAQVDAAMRRGENSTAAMVEAWGWGESDNGCELTQQTCERLSLQHTPVWTAPPTRAIVFDPAFGGRDAASFTCMEFGRALVDGKRIDVISGVEQGTLHMRRVWNPTQAEIEEYTALAKERGGRVPPDMRPGIDTSASELMTFKALQICKRLNVPVGNVSFDASQRADVYMPMARSLGRLLWFYEGSRRLTDEEGRDWKRYPVVRNPDGDIKRWSDEVTRPISMIWRLAERVISREHVRGLMHLKKGLSELRGRLWVATRGTGREDVEAKTKLLRSPTFGEGVAMCIYFSVRYLGALPELFAGSPEIDSTVPDDSIFNIRSRRLNPALWR